VNVLIVADNWKTPPWQIASELNYTIRYWVQLERQLRNIRIAADNHRAERKKWEAKQEHR